MVSESTLLLLNANISGLFLFAKLFIDFLNNSKQSLLKVEVCLCVKLVACACTARKGAVKIDLVIWAMIEPDRENCMLNERALVDAGKNSTLNQTK